MIHVLEVGVTTQRVNNDSQLVAKQASGEYQSKEPPVIKYLKKVM